MGDGEFYYLKQAFQTTKDAEAFRESKKSDGCYRYHLRTVYFRLDGVMVHIELQTELFDHAKPVAVAAAVDKSLAEGR